MLTSLYRVPASLHQVLIASPIVVARRRGREEAGRPTLDAVLLVNDGLVTSVAASGRVNWQVGQLFTHGSTDE